MKKLVLLLCLAVASFASKANDVVNLTGCSVRITPFCYEITTGIIKTFGTPQVFTSVFATPITVPSCGGTTAIGYIVERTSCPLPNTFYVSPANTFFPNNVTSTNPCTSCGDKPTGGMIILNTATDIIINMG